MNVTGLASGTLYPILARLEKAGWVQRHWEDDVTCEAEGRPRRRYYHLTPDGLVNARLTLAEIHLNEQGAPSKPFGRAKPQEA
ncbi:PadR family transcriptional regulator [Streptomyces sp. NBC_01261]|uniref:PadR family transcriptional regulator n=1 Tax=Streptomyces sp. NBC_01261 TaxID=2903802 RepID=UPI002E352DEA|nr:helix-turn-helix transcriptional regulator [Streptomyces sp. NBC_01261]